MKYLGKITDNKDLVTKEFVENKTASDFNAMDKENPTGTGSLSINRKANTTTGTNSSAIGNDTTASGNYSHAEGDKSVAAGEASHAEGSYNTAYETGAHVEGFHNTTCGLEYQHVQGKYCVDYYENNEGSTYVDVVGWGTSDSARKNISALDTSGNLRLKGQVYVGCNDNSTGGSLLGLPAVTDADNGKIMKVVNGQWAATLLSTYSGGSY